MKLITAKQAAELLGVTPSRIRQLRAAGVLRTFEQFNRKLVSVSDVKTYLRSKEKSRHGPRS